MSVPSCPLKVNSYVQWQKQDQEVVQIPHHNYNCDTTVSDQRLGGLLFVACQCVNFSTSSLLVWTNVKLLCFSKTTVRTVIWWMFLAIFNYQLQLINEVFLGFWWTAIPFKLVWNWYIIYCNAALGLMNFLLSVLLTEQRLLCTRWAWPETMDHGFQASQFFLVCVCV